MNNPLLTVEFTAAFRDWLRVLQDKAAKARIMTRIDRLQAGNPGDAKSIGEGIVEMRIDVGPGYRVCYRQKGRGLLLILCGGDKSTQPSDILRARRLAREWNDAT
jgi:putative addiction module killer protein